MSAKVPTVVALAKQALQENKCVVVGLQSTGEARTEEAVTKYVSVLISNFSCESYDDYLILYINICIMFFIIGHRPRGLCFWTS